MSAGKDGIHFETLGCIISPLRVRVETRVLAWTFRPQRFKVQREVVRSASLNSGSGNPSLDPRTFEFELRHL
jgi:hypothetical protein